MFIWLYTIISEMLFLTNIQNIFIYPPPPPIRNLLLCLLALPCPPRYRCDGMQIPSRDAFDMSRMEGLLGLTPGGRYYYAETLIKGAAQKCQGVFEERSLSLE